MNPERPTLEEHLPYFSRYIDLVPEGDINTLLESQLMPFEAKLRALSADQLQHRYAPEKWNTLQIIKHLSDTERVFSYRAVHFARGDSSPLPSFDQDTWLKQTTSQDLDRLLLEWQSVRQSAVYLFSSLDGAAWLRRGTASGHPMSSRACAYIIVGHLMYHQELLRQKYGLAV